MKKAIVFLLAFMFGFVALAVQASPVCVSQSGSIDVRGKCKTGETALNAGNIKDVLNLAAAQNKEPFNISSCRKVEETDTSDSGVAFSGVVCGGNEFLLNYGHYTEPLDLQYAVEQQVIYRDNNNIPFSVSIGVTTESADTRESRYVLHVTATCCPV